MFRAPTVAFLTASFLALPLAATHAEEGDSFPSPSLYVGVFGGLNLNLGDWDLHGAADRGASMGTSALFGLRVGAQILPFLAAELNAAMIPTSATDPLDGDLSGLALHYGGAVLITPFEGAWTPHALVGAGIYQLAGGDLGADADWEIHAGLGVRGLLLPWMALRADARLHLTDSYSAGLAPLLDIAVGVDFIPLGATPPPDRDHDGIPDADDGCPDQPGVTDAALLEDPTALGCPDTDGDRFADRDDRCLIEPGPLRFKGCPDKDGDGIPDLDDRCPAKPGLAEHGGCPPPPPDADGDGVPDEIDGCPDEPGSPRTEGCPDTDDDGIPDLFDKCPKEPGVPQENGCLPKIIQRKFSGSVKGIQFETGSAEIRKSSFRLLNEAVQVFAKYPTLRIEISGHTDNQGDASFNMRLSQERADAVKQYLTDRGIEARRIETAGYGQDRPVANNRTAGGRAKNRRIEFRILGGE
jgi:outer membrane protein OmpA-like peptidoglycan-associated protein